jgi:hypothetical protein
MLPVDVGIQKATRTMRLGSRSGMSIFYTFQNKVLGRIAPMKEWLIAICRGAAMGLGWGAAWVPLALLVALIVDPKDSMDEPWVIAGMLPGFLCGAVFSVVTGIANRRRRLDELSFGQAGARGMMSGLLVGGVWLVLALVSDPPQWLLYAVVVGSLTLLSAVSGVGTAWLARKRKSNLTLPAAP